MQNKIYSTILALLTVIALASCGNGKKFKIDGQLLNMNQGTLYVYSPTGIMQNIDTIFIEGGRFTYSRTIENEGTMILVFPNFSEIPVFAKPGKSVSMKGNAQQLSDLTISGTDENKLMNTFRAQSKDQSPTEIKKLAETFIKENATSPVTVFLLEKYFIKDYDHDFYKAFNIANEIKKAQPDNIYLAQLIQRLEPLSKAKNIGPLPSFSATDVKGNKITNESIKGKKTIIYTAAVWDYNGDMDRNVKQFLRNKEYNFNAIKVSLDASKKTAGAELDYNEDINLKIICQQQMFNSPVMKALALTELGDNIVIDANGNITARNIKPSEVESRMR